MNKIELKNISPQYELTIVFCSTEEWKKLSPKEKKDFLWVNDNLSTLPEQISRIAARIMRDVLEIFSDRTSKEGRAKVIDNLMKQVLKKMEIDNHILPKINGQMYEMYNLSPEFTLRLEFNNREVFKSREKDNSFRGRCRKVEGNKDFLETEMEISLTDNNGNLIPPKRLIQTLSHEIDHLVVETIAPYYHFVKIRDGKTMYECETLEIMYEDMFLHILETCFVWVK